MLVKIKKIKVKNSGYRREYSLESVFININNVVSISNYDNLHEFLIREDPDLSKKKFSLIKLQEGNSVEELIVLGTAESIYTDFQNTAPGRRKEILNG